MEPKRIELMHNTPEQVRGYLDEAQQIMVGHVEPELHSSALLVKLLELVASKKIQFEQPQYAAVDPRILGIGGPAGRRQ